MQIIPIVDDIGLEAYRIIYGNVAQGSGRGILHVELLKKKYNDYYFDIDSDFDRVGCSSSPHEAEEDNVKFGLAREGICVPKIPITGNEEIHDEPEETHVNTGECADLVEVRLTWVGGRG